MFDSVSRALRLSFTRREFLISAAATTASAACGPFFSAGGTTSHLPRVTILGVQDQSHLESMLTNNLATIAALYDENPDRLRDACRKVAEMTGTVPESATQYMKLLDHTGSDAYIVSGPHKNRQDILTRLLEKKTYVLLDLPFYSTLDQRSVLRESLVHSQAILRFPVPCGEVPLVRATSQLGLERQTPSRVTLTSASPQEGRPSLFRHIPELYSLLGNTASEELPIKIHAQTLLSALRTSYVFIILPANGIECHLQLHVQKLPTLRSDRPLLRVSPPCLLYTSRCV